MAKSLYVKNNQEPFTESGLCIFSRHRIMWKNELRFLAGFIAYPFYLSTPQSKIPQGMGLCRSGFSLRQSTTFLGTDRLPLPGQLTGNTEQGVGLQLLQQILRAGGLFFGTAFP